MIDFALFDLIVLALAIGGYLRYPRRSVLHDPVSATLAGLFGAADAGAAAAGAAGVGEAAAGLAEGAGAFGSTAGITAADIAPAWAGLSAADAGAAAGGAGLFGTGTQLASMGLSDIPATAAAGAPSAAAPAGSVAGSLISSPAATTTAPLAGVSTPAAAVGPTTTGTFDWLIHPFGIGATNASDAVTATDLAGNAVSPTASTAANFFGGGGGSTGLIGKAGDFIANNPLQVAGLGLGGAMALMGNKPLPSQAQLQELAAEQGTVGRTLAGYSQTGTLPPGMQQVIDANTASAKAAIRSKYASLGYSGSSAEIQALQQVDQAAAGQVAQIANQLLQQGKDFSSLSAQEFEALLNAEQQQQTGLSNSIAKFAGGLAGLRTS